jgi:polyphenol oxidase
MNMQPIRLGSASVIWTTAADGDLGHKPPGRGAHDESCCGPQAEQRRSDVRGGDWVYVLQVHGGDVLIADESTVGGAYSADAIVTEHVDQTLMIATADCSPIALSSDEGVIGAVHGGWRSLQAGIVSNTAEAMRSLGATVIKAALGPCIHADCYEFDDANLQLFAAKWGESVVGRTKWGTPAFDVPAAVAIECADAGIELVHVSSECTGCNSDYFSHRMRNDSGRQAMLVWRESD